jgi:hypothetical protein
MLVSLTSSYQELSIIVVLRIIPHNTPLTFPFPGPRFSSPQTSYTFSVPARQAIECSVLSEGANPCGDGYIVSYCTCCKDGSGGCAAPEVVRCEPERTVRLFYPSVTIPGGTNTGTGACADTGQVDCGSGCMLAADTCCPDKSCYCPVSAQCWLGADGVYGCCPLDSTCDGPASPGGGSTPTSSSAASRQKVDSLAAVIVDGLLRALRNLL